MYRHSPRQDRSAFASYGAAMLLLYASMAVASTTPSATGSGAAQAPSIPYEFCASGNVPDGTTYVSPVFQDPLRDVRPEFADYLAYAHGYHGLTKCYVLPSRASAQEFRAQRIELLHWNDAFKVVATQWNPSPSAKKAPSWLATTGESAPAIQQSPE